MVERGGERLTDQWDDTCQWDGDRIKVLFHSVSEVIIVTMRRLIAAGGRQSPRDLHIPCFLANTGTSIMSGGLGNNRSMTPLRLSLVDIYEEHWRFSSSVAIEKRTNNIVSMIGQRCRLLAANNVSW